MRIRFDREYWRALWRRAAAGQPLAARARRSWIRVWGSRQGRVAVLAAAMLAAALAVACVVYYVKFSHMIEARLGGELSGTVSRVFTAPRALAVGDAGTPEALASYLLRAGLSRGSAGDASLSAGRFDVVGSAVEIRPSARSYFSGGNALRVEFAAGRIARIRPLPKGPARSTAEVEPELLTNIFDDTREKRRPVPFAELPKVLVDAVLAAEDRRFFDHPGFDAVRVLGAAWADVRRGAKAQGASTITMQVARSFFFSTRREWSRKVAETFMALLLEQRFTKQHIFELYSNQIYLGNRASFAIRGFGEAAQAYFGRDVRQLHSGQAAFLAGIIRAPNRYSSAERKPERAAEARDRVLAEMVETKAITPAGAEAARRLPLGLIPTRLDASVSAYFVDMVKDDLLDRFEASELGENSYRIYTTLDPILEHAAAEAIGKGMAAVDRALARRRPRRVKKGEPPPPPDPAPQVALVALDAATGRIRALAGGRDYGSSQLNRVLARRQPGSAFKPFVYAAAFQGARDAQGRAITPLTTIVDEPTTFYHGRDAYTPDNYGQEFYGEVTVREAAVRSLNVATVKVAEIVGYRAIVDLVRKLGVESVQPTPALALGAYEMSPLAVAAAYTVFPNRGTSADASFIDRVVSAGGDLLEVQEPQKRAVLDPKVAYLVTSLLIDVVDRGTGATVRTAGFHGHAAGKTGTSHDGWFAGFTPGLVCVIWVGFDDNRELGLSGSASAAPIWAEFMKRATASGRYRDTQPFARPEGIRAVGIDPESRQLASEGECPTVVEEVFIEGTEPTELCTLHSGGLSNSPPISWLSRLFGRKRQNEREQRDPPGAPRPR